MLASQCSFLSECFIRGYSLELKNDPNIRLPSGTRSDGSRKRVWSLLVGRFQEDLSLQGSCTTPQRQMRAVGRLDRILELEKRGQWLKPST